MRVEFVERRRHDFKVVNRCFGAGGMAQYGDLVGGSRIDLDAVAVDPPPVRDGRQPVFQ